MTDEAEELLYGMMHTDVSLPELSAALASELALGISSKEAILQRHNVTPGQWDTLRTSPTFRHMVSEAVREWKSDLNAKRRTQLKAQILAEDGLVALDGLVHNADMPPATRVEAYKTITRIAGLAETTTDGTGSQFRVSINIGGGQGVTIDGKRVEEPLDEETG